ncbi:hypothetical protein [Lactococcus ileimucosae]|uniref:hypothetical protein n=1 Tax=Lactococcus ileimucosae TaxID=2941329 RepID=UPI0020446953|nr:hypothetical protein [Lactococcus ileimucosae]
MKRIIFLLAFSVMIWTIIIMGTILGFPILSLQLISVLLLFASFWLIKKDGRQAWTHLIIIDIMLLILLFVLYTSRYFFTYFRNNGALTEILVVAGFFVISQCVGIFWGRQFYMDNRKK